MKSKTKKRDGFGLGACILGWDSKALVALVVSLFVELGLDGDGWGVLE